MPLSKKRDKERKRLARLEKQKVQPVIDAVSPSVRREGYGKASSTVQPESPIVQPKEPTAEEVQMAAFHNFNKMLMSYVQPIPNCPDGRYRDATK